MRRRTDSVRPAPEVHPVFARTSVSARASSGCAAVVWLLLTCAASAAECRALIICGEAGPDPTTARRFADWTDRWQRLLTEVYSFRKENARVLRSPATMPTTLPADPGIASRQNVLAAIADVVARSTDEDQFVLIIIGHGYDSQGLSKVCLPGRDISDVDVARALDRLRAKSCVCVVATAASAPWAKSLARQGRVIITAAATVEMRSQPYFNEFLLRALRPGNVSVLDAFNQASMNTLRWYQNQFIEGATTTVHGTEFQEIFRAMYPDRPMRAGDAQPRPAVNDPADTKAWLGRRVLVETAGLEDNGDGVPASIYESGSAPAPLPAPGGDGLLARTVILGRP